jgi:hypothetical protein
MSRPRPWTLKKNVVLNIVSLPPLNYPPSVLAVLLRQADLRRYLFGGGKGMFLCFYVKKNCACGHPLTSPNRLELYPDSVFWYGIGWYFLGIFLIDTKGKLGKDLRYRTFGGNPFFPRFCPLFDGPRPPFEGSSHKISQNGAPPKSYSTKNTVQPY